MNQWSVARAAATESGGRNRFVSDVANLTQQYGIGWTWWVWRGDTPKQGSSAIVYYYSNGTELVENGLIDAIRPFLLF